MNINKIKLEPLYLKIYVYARALPHLMFIDYIREKEKERERFGIICIRI